jgi:hypothetical protein
MGSRLNFVDLVWQAASRCPTSGRGISMMRSNDPICAYALNNYSRGRGADDRVDGLERPCAVHACRTGPPTILLHNELAERSLQERRAAGHGTPKQGSDVQGGNRKTPRYSMAVRHRWRLKSPRTGHKAGIVCGPSDRDPDAFGARFRSSSARGRPNTSCRTHSFGPYCRMKQT